MNRNDRWLRLALRANATFSTACAVSALIGGAGLANALAIPDPAFLPVLAVNLLVFAGFLVWLSTRPKISALLGWGVVVADALWVIGTIPIVTGGVLNATGNTVALAIAGFVALWAILQAIGIRKMDAAMLEA
jgi:hypothetical protein